MPKEWVKAYKRANPDKVQAWRIKNRYKVSLDAIKALREQQANKCAICDTIKRLDIDHDHKTGAIRGLLCRRCNIAVGVIDNNRAQLDKLIAYSINQKQVA